MTDKQKQLYDLYTHIAEKAYEEKELVEQKMMDPDIDFDEYDKLINERERLRRRMKYASQRREDVRNAKTQYDKLIKQAAEIKEKYGL